MRYIFGAVLSALLMVGCSEDEPVGQFSDITLDKTFATISTDGGDVSITVKAAHEWELVGLYEKITKKEDNTRDTTYTPLPNSPEWLTVDKLSGPAGETIVTFHANATAGGREAEVCFGMNGKKQFLVVRQGLLLASSATVAEVLEAPDGKNFRVTGTCIDDPDNKYGNWHLQDATGTVYIYGTLDKEGKKGNTPISGENGWKFEVGDIITVEGPKTTYNGTVELVDVTVINIVKSLLKIVSKDTEVGIDGGPVEVKVAYKGSGAFFEIDDEAKSWITYSDTKYIPGIKTIFEQNPADTAIFCFNVAPNTGALRTAKISFSSSSYDEEKQKTNTTEMAYSIKQSAYSLPHGSRADDPFTVAEAVAKCIEIGTTTDGEIYYAKGKISSIEEVNTEYGNANFNISDDGTETNPLKCYRSFFLDNQKFTDGNAIEVGDEVIICGKLVNYKGTTPEFSGNVYIFSLKKGGSTPAADPGTLENPFNIAQAISYIDASGAEDVYVQGIVSKIVSPFDAEHGTGIFWISEDGKFNDDPAKDFEAYSIYWLGNKSWTDGCGQVAIGDKVVLCGKLTKYKTTYETSSKKAFIYSLNGKTE